MTEPNDFESIVSGLDLTFGVRDAVLELDAEWFAKHRRARFRFRPLLDGEFGDEVAERISNSEHVGRLMVVVIRDTMRVLVRPVMFEFFEDGDDD